MSSAVKSWVEAMRLRTLPVSVAGVLPAIALALMDGSYKALPAMLCLAVAVLAQIASNFANEYYDYRDGLDRPGREGPRRGVTEGDITPRAMLAATYFTLGVACAIGCSLIWWGGWWMLPAGIAIALGVVAYSAGPYPLSRHGLGEVAVIVFFGIAPVNLTYYIMAGHFGHEVLMASIAIGLMGADVLIVNNYRDAEADKAVGKHTLAVILGGAHALPGQRPCGNRADAGAVAHTERGITDCARALHGVARRYLADDGMSAGSRADSVARHDGSEYARVFHRIDNHSNNNIIQYKNGI